MLYPLSYGGRRHRVSATGGHNHLQRRTSRLADPRTENTPTTQPEAGQTDPDRMLAAAAERGLAVEVRSRPPPTACPKPPPLWASAPRTSPRPWSSSGPRTATSSSSSPVTASSPGPSCGLLLGLNMGAGAHWFSAFVDVDDLVAAYDATVADLTD